MKKTTPKKRTTVKQIGKKKRGEKDGKMKQPALPASQPTLNSELNVATGRAWSQTDAWLNLNGWQYDSGTDKYRDPKFNRLLSMHSAVIVQCRREKGPGPVLGAPFGALYSALRRCGWRRLEDHEFESAPKQRSAWTHERLSGTGMVVGLTAAASIQRSWDRNDSPMVEVPESATGRLCSRSPNSANFVKPEPKPVFCFTWIDDHALSQMVQQARGKEVYDFACSLVGKVESAYVDASGFLQGEVRLTSGALLRSRLA